jgi:uncharacterized protein (TIGR02680 family)
MTVTELHPSPLSQGRHVTEPATTEPTSTGPATTGPVVTGSAGAGEPRWRPSRAGILNVWRYYDEVFGFHRGRLLLRGPNGTGKSKALEVLLPFLLDANLRPSRLSTFGTGERTMHWNLMGEGATGTTRVGYVWLEFELPADLGGPPTRWFTCGARLSATTRTTTVHAEYFTTGLRVGMDAGLRLVNESGQPLTARALIDALGEHGEVHPTAADYRAAVRSQLFPGLSGQRYDALITALLQLRTPKLSQRLDPALLSDLLSSALPPLGRSEISELAEGFERLDRQRRRLADLDLEVAAADTLAARQRGYARRVLRAAAAALVAATTELDKLTRTARESQERYEVVGEQLAGAQHHVQSLTSEIDDVEARIAGLTAGDAYRQGQELDQLRQDAATARDTAVRLARSGARRRVEAGADARASTAATEAAAAADAEVTRLASEAGHAGRRAGLEGLIAQATAGAVHAARGLLRGAVGARRHQIAAVHTALDAHERAIDRRRDAEGDVDRAREDLAGSRRALEAAGERCEQARTQLAERVDAWARGCRELVFDDPAAPAGLVDSEADLVAAVDEAARRVGDALAVETATVSAERDRTLARRAEVATELDRLRRERDLPPPVPYVRAADRTGRAGAPLWRLVRFTGDADGSLVGDDRQARIEAALEAAGILDAWVEPTGAIAGHDVFARPDAVAPAPGPSLADVLRPEDGGAVPADRVDRLLRSIAHGDTADGGHPAAVGADGTWRLGPLSGSWGKAHAEYIGAVARERTRARRVAELTGEVDELDRRLDDLAGVLSRLGARRRTLEAERRARPSHAGFDAARADLTRAESDVAAADRTLRRCAQTLQEREGAVLAALHELTVVAADHGIPADRDGLAGLARALDTLHDVAERWLDARGELASAQGRAESLAERARQTGQTADEAEAEAARADRDARALTVRLAAIESTVGTEYRVILEEIDRLRSRLRELRTDREETGERVTRLATDVGSLDHQRRRDESARDGAVAVRDTAAGRFRHLASGSVAADGALADEERFRDLLAASAGVRATLEAARLVAAAWATVPFEPKNVADALHRLSEEVHACRERLGERATLELEQDDDVTVLTAVVDGVRVGAAELLRLLRTEAERSRQDITERERELFDRTLTGDTRRHLAARIRQAGELVDGMNARLERVRTASDVAVRLVWQVAEDLPPGTRTARDLLLKDPARLSGSDRDALHRFFRDRIEAARAEDTATSWEQQLAQVFDYTSWHRFLVKVDRGTGDGWQVLTKRLHGALSGGEKAIALHLPLFAAVAAHYQAVPTAPRVILLDEVFVGVDSVNRGQVFDLLSALDLDLVLTSDHEWCTYRELDGIAIHQLVTGGDGDDAVTTARFVWNGHDLVGGHDQDEFPAGPDGPAHPPRDIHDRL